MLIPAEGLFATPPTARPSQTDVDNLQIAITEARKGLQEGGIPIGGALVLCCPILSDHTTHN